VGGVVLDRSSPSTVMVLGGLPAVLMVLAAWSHWAGRFTWSKSS
jgi:hypothetical protein